MFSCGKRAKMDDAYIGVSKLKKIVDKSSASAKRQLGEMVGLIFPPDFWRYGI